MTYVLAKYTVLFLLTALLGFALGYWFSRRKFVDVTESYEDLRTANSRSDASHWNTLWGRLDSLPAPKETDLTEVYEGIAGVKSAIAGLPQPEAVSFAPIDTRLDSLQESIRSIPAPLKPKEPDFQPLVERLEALDKTVKAIPVPEKPAPVDFTVVTRKLDKLENAVHSIPKPPPARDVDLRPVTSQLNSLEQRFATIPEPQNVDLAPIDRRLTAIETELGKLGKRLARRTTTERPSRDTHRDGPRILSAALYGNQDDLKGISGVGPKLEKLLNKNGVFYFWQVAEWNARDIEAIDERLDVFKGRIARDNWVTQAKKLRQLPDAASMPAD